ncbi:MAG: PAS domain S-box protein [Deltaproteobacteria bacterium]|nr:PAS domain S-box protein [Deltaproteobacteria bacterium]
MKKSSPKNKQVFKELRSRAEKSLLRRSVDSGAFPDKDIEKLIQELRVHQIELEMQNEELRIAQAELAESRDRYFDLYDLAPVGYFTLDEKGLILEVNLACADLLGSDRAALIRQRFSRFVSPRSQDTFYSHWKQSLRTDSKQVCELELKRKGGQAFYAQLQSVAVQENEGKAGRLRMAVVDITVQKAAEMALLDSHDHLESKVEERTADLLVANAQLEEQIEERVRMEKALLQSENELHLLTSRLLTIQEDERKSIALDLHDTIAQNLVAIRIFMETKLKTMADSPPPGVSLERIHSMVGECLADLRRILDHLRPSILDDLGLLIAIHRFCEEFQEMNHELRLEREITLKEKDIPEKYKIVVYRILQEALNNVSKHSQARSVRVSLRTKEGGVELRIEDDGVGFDVDEIHSNRLGGGIGLSSLQERAYLSGGSISILSRKGGGTAVVVSWNC